MEADNSCFTTMAVVPVSQKVKQPGPGLNECLITLDLDNSWVGDHLGTPDAADKTKAGLRFGVM